MEYIVVGCRSLVALVFLISAVSKLRDRRSYAGFVWAWRAGRSPMPHPTSPVR
ncbi:hypothetical protein IMZ11_28610 [Microtetraspora sp. AC03309]|uniref:hypothetical protein n=1 Tax=Microtetraspora sp. AC03309 TaxID=2779376 RepID=UPI001E65A95C|nr:hypothetical protein [Microtetraspora sp. AC03309]MCC5579598.1 hypothetical protein [Microtetraspora sp. AC03309]